MATGNSDGRMPGKRAMRDLPSRLELNDIASKQTAEIPASLRGAPSRQPHDSVLDSTTSRHASALRSPFIVDGYHEFRNQSPWNDEDATAVEAHTFNGQTPTSRLPAPRKDSLYRVGAATSPLAYTAEDEFLHTAGSPPRKASAGSSPNTSQEQWWRTDSMPGSAQPSPRFARSTESRASATNGLPSPGFVGVANSRLRGMTTSSAHAPSLHHSASHGDLRMSNRTMPASVYKPSRRPDGTRDSGHSALRREHFVPPFAEASRASVRSAWTAQSSGFLGSDRSSVMTRASSASELNRINQPVDDLLMSVEDAINMYSQGFTDDSPDEEESQDEAPARHEPHRPRERSVSPALEHSSTFDERIHGSERTPMPARSSSDPQSDILTSSSRYQRSYELDSPTLAGPVAHNKRHEHTHIVPQGEARDWEPRHHPIQSSRSPSYPDITPDLSTSSHEVPPFETSSRDTPSSSQPRTPTSRDDVFSSGPSQRRDPRPPDTPEEPLPYLPLPASLQKQKQKNTPYDAGDFANPRSPPDLPPPPTARDRYGFKKVTQYINEQQYDAWDKQYTPYLARRRMKWDVLMKQFGLSTENPVRFPPKTEKVKRYIRKGIPPEWRGAAWFWYAGGPGRLTQNSGLYWSLIEQVQHGKLSDSDREHIERDLNRTFPDNVHFKPDAPRRKGSRDSTPPDNGQPADTVVIRALRRLLQAFAVHKPSIGYCQSLNFLAGLLLLFLDQDEEKAFIMLDVITSIHLPGTHAKVLEANVDIGVLMTCIQESMPAVWAKIDDNAEEMIPKSKGDGGGSVSRLPTVSLATTAWFMSCFIGNLPVECVLRVWDIFFFEGSKTLFRIALTIFKLGEPEIRGITEHMEIFQLVQTIPRRLIDANLLMEACYKRRNGFQYLSQDTVDQRRVERRRILADERARKLGGAKSVAQQGNNEPVAADDETRSRRDVAGSLKRAASRARMKRSQSRRRAPTVRE